MSRYSECGIISGGRRTTNNRFTGEWLYSPFIKRFFSGMELSSPFLKILPYEVARGWVEGLNGHKVSVEGAANIISNNF